MEPSGDISKRLAIFGLVVILGLGAWARLDGLGRFSFWTDELYHVIAAQSMLEGDGPLIPARGDYWRSFIATGMTAASFATFGESEWSARLPFAIVSLIFLLIAYRIIAARFTRLLGLAVVLLLALTPQFLQAGRECRMYAPFVLLYFMGVFAAYRAMESPPGGARRNPAGVAFGLCLAGMLFGLATSLHFLAVNFGVSLAVYCLLMAGHVAATGGAGPALRSRYAVVLGLMVLGVAACAFLTPGIMARLIGLARTTEPWDTRGRPVTFCLWFFNYYYPALWFVYPLGAVILIRRYGRLGVFIVCAFLPVLLAHMYLFTSRIAERYLLYILPFFFLTGSAVIEAVLGRLAGWVRQLGSSGARATAAAAVLASVPAMGLFMNPWLSVSRDLRRYGLGPDWKQIAPELREACDTGTVVSNWPREVMYYGGRFPDYFATQSYEQFGNRDHVVVIGESRIAVRYLLDAESLEHVLREGPDVYFVTTDWAFANDAFTNEAMRELIRQRMKELASVASGNDRAVIYQYQARQP